MASRSRRTEVPWNPTGGGVGGSVFSAFDSSVAPSFAGSRVEVCKMCILEASIGGCSFAVPDLKNLHLKLTSRPLSKGPRILASDVVGAARLGRREGNCNCRAVRMEQSRDKVDPNSWISSGEYTGGREDSRVGMIRGGSGAAGSLRRGWRKTTLVTGDDICAEVHLPLTAPAVIFLSSHRQGIERARMLCCFHCSRLRASSTPIIKTSQLELRGIMTLKPHPRDPLVPRFEVW